MGGSKSSGAVYKAEEVVTPAVARSIAADTESAQAAQAEARSRKRGIRSTYNRFASQNSAMAGGTGAADKLG